MERMNVRIAQRRPQLPNFRVGDAIQVSYALENSEKDSAPIRGTVMGKWKKGVDSKFAIVNNLDGEWYTATYTHASPLLRGVKILQRNRVNDGLKRARRAKLTNLLHAVSSPMMPGLGRRRIAWTLTQSSAQRLPPPVSRVQDPATYQVNEVSIVVNDVVRSSSSRRPVARESCAVMWLHYFVLLGSSTHPLQSTKEAAEVQKDKEARRAAMRAGKSLKKKTDRSQPGAKADAAAGGKGAAAGKGAAPAKAAAPSAKGAAKK